MTGGLQLVISKACNLAPAASLADRNSLLGPPLEAAAPDAAD